MAFGIDDALMLGSSALPIIGGLIAQAVSAGDQDKANQLRAYAQSMYGPDALNQLNAVQSQSMGPSAMGGVNADPQAVEMQREALRGLQEGANTRGLTAAEQADFDQAQNEAGQYEAGQRGAIIDNANARGIGGSGFELASRLAAEQGGAMRASQAAQQAAAAAARRQALAQMQLGQQAGQFREQGFGEGAQKAQAADAVSRFNTQNSNDFAKWRYGQQADIRNHAYDAAQTRADQYSQNAQNTRDAFTGAGSTAGAGLDWYRKNRSKG